VHEPSTRKRRVAINNTFDELYNDGVHDQRDCLLSSCMYRLLQKLINLVLFLTSDPTPSRLNTFYEPSPEKSILVIGGGSAGLGALKVLLDIPSHARSKWEIVLYEQRHDIGGIW
jgi:hypothetical protein